MITKLSYSDALDASKRPNDLCLINHDERFGDKVTVSYNELRELCRNNEAKCLRNSTEEWYQDSEFAYDDDIMFAALLTDYYIEFIP